MHALRLTALGLPALLIAAAAAGQAGDAATRATTKAASADEVIAKIGSFELTRDLFDAMWQALPPDHRAAYESRGGQADYLDDYIQQKLAAVQAVELGLDKRPATIAALENARNAILGRLLVDEQVTQKIVTEAAMKQYYQDHLDGFTIPERIRARHIVVTPHKERLLKNSSGDDATDADQARDKVERIKAELDSGADFAELATTLSEDLTASTGGMLEEFSRGRMARAIDDAAFALEPGGVSGVVETPYGYHFIKVEEKFPERQQTFEEVKDRIAVAVAQDKRAEFKPRLDAYTAELRKSLGVAVLADDLQPSPDAEPASQPATTKPATP